MYEHTAHAKIDIELQTYKTKKHYSGFFEKKSTKKC